LKIKWRSSHSVLDVVNALTQKGRIEEAVGLLVNVSVLAEIRGVDNLTVLKLTVDEYIEYQTPKPLLRPEGKWDRVLFGDAAFR